MRSLELWRDKNHKSRSEKVNYGFQGRALAKGESKGTLESRRGVWG